jgi:hypothetical protein
MDLRERGEKTDRLAAEGWGIGQVAKLPASGVSFFFTRGSRLEGSAGNGRMKKAKILCQTFLPQMSFYDGFEVH